MDSLQSLEERVLLAVQTIRQLREENARLKEEGVRREEELTAVTRQRDELREKWEGLKNLAKENEILKTKQDEIRARVEQLIAKLDALEKEWAEGEGGQTELLAEGEG